MKYCFLVLSFFIGAASLSAQSDITNKILSDIYKKAGLENKIRRSSLIIKEHKAATKAAEDSYVPEVILAYAETDSGVTVTRDSVIYNNTGLPLVAINQVNAGSGWINVQKDSSVYDGSKAVFSETLLWRNEAWTSAAKKYMEYNGQGLLMRLIGETATSGGTLKYEIRYAYDGSDRLSEITYYNVDSIAVPQMRYSFTYNAAGETIENLQQLAAGDSWVNYALETHEFNGNGFETLEQYQIWEANNWVTYERNTYDRNSAGLVVSTVSQLRASGVLENNDSLFFTYDEKGNMMTEISSYWDEGSWLLMDSLKFAYDASNRVIMEEWHMRVETEWLKWSRKNYTYGSQDNLVLLLTEQGTAENAWENLGKVEYQYDIVGNLVKGESFLWAENAWVNANGALDMGYNYYNAYLADARYIRVGSVAVEDDNLNPNSFSLGQNYPNPFNPETKISFLLPQSGQATLKIYDTLGREVAELINGAMEKGAHTVNFSGRNLSSGVYIYRLQSGNFTESKKMMLMK